VFIRSGDPHGQLLTPISSSTPAYTAGLSLETALSFSKLPILRWTIRAEPFITRSPMSLPG